MRDYWKILGLDEPPTDMKSAKRAYAAKLKVTRPDDNPEGFMELRDAFEIAKQHIYYAQHEKERIARETVEPSETSQEDVSEFLHEDTRPAQPTASDELSSPINRSVVEENTDTQTVQKSTEPEYPLFYEDIQSILKDPAKRNDKDIWGQLIEKARESSIDEYIDFDVMLRRLFLAELGYYDGNATKHNRNRKPPLITSFVATYLFKAMEWHKLEERDYYTQEELDWLRVDIDVMNFNRNPMNGSSSAKLIDTNDDTNLNMWIIIGGIIAGLQLLRLIMNTIGGGGY